MHEVDGPKASFSHVGYLVKNSTEISCLSVKGAEDMGGKPAKNEQSLPLSAAYSKINNYFNKDDVLFVSLTMNCKVRTKLIITYNKRLLAKDYASSQHSVTDKRTLMS